MLFIEGMLKKWRDYLRGPFVIGSRFQSIILGVLFGKRVFSIPYNCKTEKYLAALQFTAAQVYVKAFLGIVF